MWGWADDVLVDCVIDELNDTMYLLCCPRKTINRDLMEGRKEMSSQDADKLMEMAKELGGRFSRTFR